MTDLFPELKGLSGGKKWDWSNQHRELVLALYYHSGFEKTCQLLHMKEATLHRTLKRLESSYRPAITHADKAMLKAKQAEEKADDAIAEINTQTDRLDIHLSEDAKLREYFAQYFEIQSKINGQMADLVKSVPNLTYHIASPKKQKVGLTRRNPSGRLLLSSGQGRKQLPRPVKKNPRHQHRFRKRWPGV